ncbi:hypothetical protein JHK82_018631 [Glycine max]|nr:hypothetical protein JHK82_018631 [Glycine max]
MGNCCRSPAAVAREDVKSSFSNADHGKRGGGGSASAAAKQKAPITVLAGVPKENIEDRYLVDRELGRGEFGVTYLCIDRDTRELLACKSISKRKLRTAVDVEDVRREVAIMRHLPESPSIVSLREACEDDNAVHLVMELCEGGELFDRIVARGHYTERAAAAVTRTIVEVVQLCHKHGVIHRDLKPENFLFANKKENSPLKAIDFGLSIFFKPGFSLLEVGTVRFSAVYSTFRVCNVKGEVGGLFCCPMCQSFYFPLPLNNIAKCGMKLDLIATVLGVATRNVFGSVLMVIFKHIKVIGSGFGLELVLILDYPVLDSWFSVDWKTSCRYCCDVAMAISQNLSICLNSGACVLLDILNFAVSVAWWMDGAAMVGVTRTVLLGFCVQQCLRRKLVIAGERFSEIVGSPYYMAPEVLKRNYGPEIDIWSAGVILYILLCGVPPFWAESEQGVAQAILRGLIDFKREPWPSISESAKSLVRQMLEPDPKLRLTAKQVLEHPWLQNAKKAPNVPLGDVVKSRLKQFSMMNRFKRKALRVIADFLSNEEVEDIKDMFKKMDNDNDGIVSIEELKAGFRNFGSLLADSEVQLLIEAVDSNGKGTLDYGEFVAVSLHLRRMANDDHLHKAFSYFDKDGNGYIEPDELRNALMEDGADDCTDVANDIFLEVDTDKDGRISYDEFVAMMKTGTDWRKASRHYSRGRFNSLSLKLMKDGSLNLGNE